MKNRIALLLLVILVSAVGCTTNPLAWQFSVDRQAGTRFIPIELWSGDTWAGERTITPTKADFTFGRRNHKTISGPFQWKHPITGETLWVYERINETTRGTKRQLFTINPDGTGLAKVYDSRPDMPTRYFSTNAVLFPLGRWGKGEKRWFAFKEYVAGNTYDRRAMVYMRRLSFTYKETTYALKYDWIMKDVNQNILFHERFIYGPGKSLMYFKNRLQQ